MYSRGIDPARDFVRELEPRAGLGGLDSDEDVAELPAPAGLPDESALLLDGPADGLPVCNLRPSDVGVDTELAPEPVDDDLEVQLAHAGDDRLARLLVARDPERGVFLGELAERDPHAILIRLGLRLDRDGDHGIGELHPLERDGGTAIAQRLAGRHGLEPHRGGDVAGPDLRNLLAVVGVHLKDASDPLRAALDGVVDPVSGLQDPRIHAEEREGSDVRVGGDLEREGRERLVIGGAALFLRLARVHGPADRGYFVGRRKEFDDGVQERLDALVLECRAAQHGHHFVGQGPDSQAAADLVRRQLPRLQITLHERVVRLGRGLHQDLAAALRLDLEIGGAPRRRRRRPPARSRPTGPNASAPDR